MVGFTALLLISGTAAAVTVADDQVRKFADQIAELIVEAQDEQVYGAIAPTIKRAYSHRELTQPLVLIRNMNGSLQAYEFKSQSFGKRGVGGAWIKQVRFVYAIKTARHPKGRYLNVDVTFEEGKYWLAGYSVERFLGVDEPSFLENPAR